MSFLIFRLHFCYFQRLKFIFSNIFNSSILFFNYLYHITNFFDKVSLFLTCWYLLTYNTAEYGVLVRSKNLISGVWSPDSKVKFQVWSVESLFAKELCYWSMESSFVFFYSIFPSPYLPISPSPHVPMSRSNSMKQRCYSLFLTVILTIDKSSRK